MFKIFRKAIGGGSGSHHSHNHGQNSQGQGNQHQHHHHQHQNQANNSNQQQVGSSNNLANVPNYATYSSSSSGNATGCCQPVAPSQFQFGSNKKNAKGNIAS